MVTTVNSKYNRSSQATTSFIINQPFTKQHRRLPISGPTVAWRTSDRAAHSEHPVDAAQEHLTRLIMFCPSGTIGLSIPSTTRAELSFHRCRPFSIHSPASIQPVRAMEVRIIVCRPTSVFSMHLFVNVNMCAARADPDVAAVFRSATRRPPWWCRRLSHFLCGTTCLCA